MSRSPRDTHIGADALIHSGARIGRAVRIGARFIAQPGAVIGADGFSFVTPEKSRAEAARETMGDAGDAQAQSWTRIHSLGSVMLGDDIEVGANSCIDAGTIRPTRIGDGTKIDNQVHVAHNCEVGRDCLFAGQVGIAGSVKIGDNVILGGQVGVVDNIFIGDGVVAGGGTVILVECARGPGAAGLSGGQDGDPCRNIQGDPPLAAAGAAGRRPAESGFKTGPE